jgi:hypothetical protein
VVRSVRLAVVLGALVLAAGCGFMRGPQNAPIPPGETCVDIEPVACKAKIKETVDGLAPGRPPIVGVLVRCTKAPCTDLAGEGETIVQFADGSQTGSGWAFAQAPAPGGAPPAATPLPVEPVCIGIAREACIEFGTGEPADPAKQGIAITGIVVRCTTSCDARAGEGKTTFTYSDGTTQETSWNYASS